MSDTNVGSFEPPPTWSRGDTWIVARAVFATLLLATAFFKVELLFSHDGLAYLPSVRGFPLVFSIAIAIELLICGWLAHGRSPAWCWRTVALVYLVFAVFAGALTIAGSPTCGCLGRVNIPPLFMFCLDAIVLAGLPLVRPLSDAPPVSTICRRLSSGLLMVSRIPVVIAGGVALAFAVAYLVFESPAQLVSFVRDDPVVANQSLLQLGAGVPGTERDISVSLHNRTTEPITITAAKVDCWCVRTHGLPVQIPSRSSRQVSATYRFGNEAGPFLQRIVFLSANVDQPPITVLVSGRVHSTSGSSEITKLK